MMISGVLTKIFLKANCLESQLLGLDSRVKNRLYGEMWNILPEGYGVL